MKVKKIKMSSENIDINNFLCEMLIYLINAITYTSELITFKKIFLLTICIFTKTYYNIKSFLIYIYFYITLFIYKILRIININNFKKI